MPTITPLGALRSSVISGVDATLVTVEVHRDDGIPSETIVGLPGKAVRESLDRIHGACRRSDVYLEPRRTTINLAPADHPKAGTGLDLPIALGMLAADGAVDAERLVDTVCLGELQLDGSLRGVPGVLPAAIETRRLGLARLLIPRQNAAEAAAVDGLEVIALHSLTEVVRWARGELTPAALPPAATAPDSAHQAAPDLGDIAGHAIARRALEIAAAGGHHMLMVGLPGSGKTLLARAIPGILPPLSRHESLETSAVYSVVHQLGDAGLLRRRPFRSPHHSVTGPGLIGGGVPPRPGEVSFAHGGVLFLDELPEFHRPVLEALRQPLEEGSITLVRGGRVATLPARFQLVAAMNPCPCGRGPGSPQCRCMPGQVRSYWRKLSGPLLDRIDVVIYVDAVPLDELIRENPEGEPSASVRRRVVQARERQAQRWIDLGLETNATASRINASLPASCLGDACGLTAGIREQARQQAQALQVSARGWHRVLRVARTIADLEGDAAINGAHLAEAFQYRQTNIELGDRAAQFTGG